MPSRALIIAVENYPNVAGGGMAATLPGTLAAALDFKAWLLAKWNTDGLAAHEREIHFLSEPVQPDGRAATSTEIRNTLLQIRDDGRNATDDFFFFFSGHGFMFAEKLDATADVIIPSDFVDADHSGNLCFKLDEIVGWARAHLGPGRHYYFVDACRNRLDASTIRISLQLPFNPQTTAEAATFVMQSTARGATAIVGGAFPDTLMAGLRGTGSAKVWGRVRDAMFVRYESLRRYVRTKLKDRQMIASEVYGPDGEGESEATLARIVPIPLSTCTVRVHDTSQTDQGHLSLVRGRSRVPQELPLQIPETQLQLEPDDYAISVALTNATVEPAEVPVDLYEDCIAEFRKVPGVPTRGGGPTRGGAPPAPPHQPAPPSGSVNVVVPPAASLSLRNVRSGVTHTVETSGIVSLPVGEYLATQLDSTGEPVKRVELSVAADERTEINILEWRGSTPHAAIANHFPHGEWGVDFSESLGAPVLDADLHLWLALLGGGRVLSRHVGDYSKISIVPLRSFENEPPDASPVYVLAGFEDVATDLRLAISRGPAVSWTPASPVPTLPGVQEYYESRPAGPALLSIRVGDKDPYTIATATLPNRATLVVLTLEPDGGPRLTQFLLPLGHLVPNLPPEVQQRLSYRTPLQDVHFVAQASRAYRKRRRLAKVLPNEVLDALLYAKWVDPIGSALASYELVRRGRSSELGEVVSNMQRFFPELPDTRALARLAGRDPAPLEDVPLFADGTRADPTLTERLPLPAGHLDYGSPWTAWRAAVVAERVRAGAPG